MNFDPAIKAALRRQIKDGLGGIEAAAELVGMGKTQLANYTHPDRGERVPLVVAMRLDEAAGVPLILTAAASLIGYRLTRLDGDEAGSISLALAGVEDASRILVVDGIRAGADLVYTTAERRGLAQRIAAVQEQLASLSRAIGSESEP